MVTRAPVDEASGWDAAWCVGGSPRRGEPECRGEEEKVWESEGLAGCGPAEAGCIWPRCHLETLLTSEF